MGRAGSMRVCAGTRLAAWAAVGIVGAALTIGLATDEDDEWEDQEPMVLLAVAFFACIGRAAYLGAGTRGSVHSRVVS